MVLDPSAELLYLFGGWDGNQDLSDLWSYNIATNKWTLICKDTETVVSSRRRTGSVRQRFQRRNCRVVRPRDLVTRCASIQNVGNFSLLADIWTRSTEHRRT